MISQESLALLQRSFPDAVVMKEGGQEFVFIPKLPVVTNRSTDVTEVDALLCPSAHSSYTTRLFLEKPFVGAGQSNNWSIHRILERQWHTWSWNNVPPGNALLQILASHLNALK